MKAFVYRFVALFLVLSLLLFCGSKAFAQKNSPTDSYEVKSNTVAYTLPYPGMLPDSPFYGVKKARDSLWVFFTRDPLKKAEVLLLLSDKKVVMATHMAEKGKWSHVEDLLSESEDNIDRIVKSLELATKIGSSPTADFVDKVRMSSSKHEEVMEDLLKDAPQGNKENIETLIQVNIENYNEIERL